mmetsp:Transcript_5807/g.7305  ORF Transcript_5807/g.7305 Transcript_5807/m.7305 type:complete len:351 (+) Transcript_5807:190-1242(+)
MTTTTPSPLPKNPFAMTIVATLLLLLTLLSNSNGASFVMKMSSESQKVAVIGATGKLGREAVMQLSSRGVPTKCLLRHDIKSVTPSIEPNASSKEVAAYLATLPGVEMVRGDVTSLPTLKTLLRDCTACLALHGAARTLKITDLLPWGPDPTSDAGHAKQTNYVGVQNIIEAVRDSPICKRVVRITGKGENPWGLFSILINLLGGMAKAWNYEGEQLLRNSKINYTIIRPGVMGPPCPEGSVLALADNGADLKVSPVKYASIANLCIESLDYDNANKATLTAMNVPDGEGEKSYGPLLAKVRPDSRVFPESLMKEHLLAVRVGAVGILGVVSILLAGLGAFLKAVVGMIL